MTRKARGPLSGIQEQVEASLRRRALSTRRMHVAASGGLVTLTGEVPSLFDKESAERAAWSVPGVGGVHNLLTVSDP